MKYPWEVPAEPPIEEIMRAIQADILFALKHTAILVRSSNEVLRMIVNTERGQVLPAGVCTFTDGTTVEMQDIGMPQVGIPTMTVQELTGMVLRQAYEMGLELA
jgi:hypothetical protein